MPPRLEVELAVFLLDEAYHDSAVQLSVGIMPHDAGEAPAVVFGLGDDFYGFGFGGAVMEPAGSRRKMMSPRCAV